MKFLQILIPTQNEILVPLLKDEKKLFSRISPWAYF
jgi:hypothetical protein